MFHLHDLNHEGVTMFIFFVNDQEESAAASVKTSASLAWILVCRDVLAVSVSVCLSISLHILIRWQSQSAFSFAVL